MSRKSKKRNRPKRTITIVLRPIDGADPKEFLEKLAEETNRLVTKVRATRSTESDDDVQDRPSEGRTFGNEQLEESTHEHVDKVLKEKNARIAAGEKAAAVVPSVPVEKLDEKGKESQQKSKILAWGRAFGAFISEWSANVVAKIVEGILKNQP
ncbi:MAG: hypothetical protein AABZ47_07125 [Planctomycetota bacterium]